jgi:type I restriction enzyme M protein
MCEVVQPTPQDRICDPAAGTGAFLCNAYQYLLDRFEKQLDSDLEALDAGFWTSPDS